MITATIEKGISGFKNTEIYPLNRKYTQNDLAAGPQIEKKKKIEPMIEDNEDELSKMSSNNPKRSKTVNEP